MKFQIAVKVTILGKSGAANMVRTILGLHFVCDLNDCNGNRNGICPSKGL